jgi:hypothetical protein
MIEWIISLTVLTGLITINSPYPLLLKIRVYRACWSSGRAGTGKALKGNTEIQVSERERAYGIQCEA